jgi:N-acyl-D-aspartate/D-glutamate deacylase
MADAYDVLIRGATLYDGTGKAPRSADLALRGDRIARIGMLGDARAALEIDATGLALAPGFIDVHTHDDFALVVRPEMDFKILGGVTTVVVGNCGIGAAPWAMASKASALIGSAVLPEWEGYSGYIALLEREPASTNAAVLIGHGTARRAVMKNAQRAPTPGELDAMKAIVREGLDAGAVGLSTGLVYEPGSHAQIDEIAALAAEMAGTGALYATHMRNEGTGLLDSVREAIEIGRRSGVPVQISHHKASGRDAWGLVSESLKLIERAQAEGLDVHADQYPYTAGSTFLDAVLRNGAFIDGESRGLGRLEPADVAIAAAPGHREWEGRTILELAKSLGKEPRAAAEQIAASSPGASVVMHVMTEDDVRTVMRHPSTMIGSDGVPTLPGKPHPRLWGTFARVLGHYARDLGLFPIEEAVYRMTGFSAKKFGLHDRGVIAEGKAADLVLFDPARIIDVGTYEDPNHPPAGIHHVFVNGTRVVREGAHTGARPGRPLRRGEARA